MKKSIKIVSLIFVFLSFIACDNSGDDVVNQNELFAKYTYVKESMPGKVSFINTSSNADRFEWDFGDNTTSTIKNPIKTYTQTGEYTVKLTARRSATGTSSSFTSIVSIYVFEGGLITNGDFETGTAPWTLGVTNAIPSVLLATNNGNTYFSIPVNAAGNPYDVNLSQVGLELTQGTTYRLTFEAWSDVNRSMIVGIGLSGPPYTNQSVTRDLTPTVQDFSIDLVANFTNTNSRVIFDLGASIGRVNIDNVKLNPLP